ncbi:hypothetical protein L0128_10000 [candidate division KSB1 bacterium]|nr:hypothetical protein [candidate division KSB1 bacterium]
MWDYVKALPVMLSSFFWLGLTCCFCAKSPPQPPAAPTRDIKLVMKDHTAEIMALPGVVGIYIGEIENHQPCIKVMVVKKTAELEQKIPKKLEGYPVEIDETGVIRALE